LFLRLYLVNPTDFFGFEKFSYRVKPKLARFSATLKIFFRIFLTRPYGKPQRCKILARSKISFEFFSVHRVAGKQARFLPVWKNFSKKFSGNKKAAPLGTA